MFAGHAALLVAAAPSPLSAQMSPDLIRAQCETVHEIPDQSILYGFVVDNRSGTPLPGSTVYLSWVTNRGSSDSTVNRAQTGTADGAYIFCDVPQDTRLIAWADAMGETSAVTEFHFEGGESTREDLEIRLRAFTGAVAGVVVDARTGEPIEAATVAIPFADASALTNAEGHFRLRDVPIGTQQAEIHHLAYGDPTLEVEVSSAITTYLTIRLEPQAIALEPLSVQVTQRRQWLETRGFYERMESQLGQFVTPEEVNARPYRRFHEVLREVPGVGLREVCTPHCSVRIEMAGSTQPGCIPTFYVDGRQVHQLVDTRGNIDLDTLVFGNDLAAVEVYRGIAQTPAQFFGRCGSVVIWTKRGAG
ncbi:MAG: carboxypeptidase-like regulatory domain-containing protein [Gemmatimonadetes bacterium]|nr:carboxypeptidase-like regulatory domain-containing protein [Gemmatimonadota bacterium]